MAKGSAMGVKTGETRCPGCGAMVPFEEGQRQARCEYCGSPVTIDEDDQVIRNVDEADLKRAETEQLVRLKELELKEREIERKNRRRPLMVVATVVLLVILVVCFTVGFSANTSSAGFLVVGLIVLNVLIYMWLAETGDGDK